MARAARETKPLSAMFNDPVVRRAFERAERDGLAPTLVEPERPEPILTGGAVRELELV